MRLPGWCVGEFSDPSTCPAQDGTRVIGKTSSTELREPSARGDVLSRKAAGLVAAITGILLGALLVPGTSQADENPPAAPKPATEIEKWFVQVDGPQEEAFQKQVVKAFDSSLLDLRAHYIASLDAALARASAAGQLDEALAYRTERQAFEKTWQVADDNATTSAALKSLRAAFRQQLAKLEIDRVARARALFAEYDAVLTKYQNLLTQHGRLDDALLLQAKREQIARTWLGATQAALMTGPEAGKAGAAAGMVVATKDAPFVNTLGMKFAPVPGTPTLFSVWDTRVQDYAAYARGKNVDGHWTTQEKDGTPTSREPAYPVVGVSWDDAQAFCRWLTEKEITEGRLPKTMKYRLPTDEEWSRAVGLGIEPGETPGDKHEKNQAAFPWGGSFPPPGPRVGNYADSAWHEKFPKEKWLEGYTDGYATTSPVGSFPANAYGLYDMGGNVWQWCEDYYNEDHNHRVFRGASWVHSGRGTLLSSHRLHRPPGARDNDCGFRCVLAFAAAAPAEAAPSSLATVSATKDAPFVNSLSMKFVPVPGTPALFSIWDTRVRDYGAFARAISVDENWTKQGKDGVEISREPDDPVVAVNWDDAHAFCAWLTDKERNEGKLPKGMMYRLPTDEEWSRAVGLDAENGATPAEKNGKHQTAFPWGTGYPPDKAGVGNFADSALHERFPKDGWIEGYTDGFVTTSPVGSFPANSYGLYDMGGNVWQWCEDWYDSQKKEHPLRGGCWNNSGRILLLSTRIHHKPGERGNGDGFRCVLAPVPAATAPADSTFLAAGTPKNSAELVKMYRNSLVFVTGTNGSGSAFLAKYGENNVLFTNAHVVVGVKGAVLKTLDGGEVKVGAASAAVGHDVCLLQATTTGPALEIMNGVDANAAIGDEVVVLGNAEGAGVVNTIKGKIVGIGPQLVEVDAPFQPGNSGSPIIHLKSGQVIGVATYAIIRRYDLATGRPLKEPSVRRFGYRLDSIKSWQPIEWNAFSAQAAKIDTIGKFTGDLVAFLGDLRGAGRATIGTHNNPDIKDRMDSWLRLRGKRSKSADPAADDQNFVSFIKATCEGDIAAARQQITYDYFQRELADQQTERDAIVAAFNNLIQSIRQRK